MKLLVCAGGTGGGIYPALAAVSELRSQGMNSDQVLWVGTFGQMEEELVPAAGLRLTRIQGGPIVGVSLRESLPNAAKLTRSVGTALKIISEFRPDVMFMTGGYMAPPVALAARLSGVPIGIYLPDVEPGSSIKSVIPLARQIACTTDGSAAFVPTDKMVVTGYPVRPEIRTAVNLSKEQALAVFDLRSGRQTLFVFGGSRGAQAINQALMSALPELLQDFQIIHSSGTFTWSEVEEFTGRLDPDLRRWYRPFPYLNEEMGAAFRAADLVVARAGASMLGEGPAFGLPAILVPLTFAWRYQKVNADYLVKRGAAVQLTDETLPYQLAPTVTRLLKDQERLAAMGVAAKSLDIPQATTELARFITNLAKDKGA